MVLLKLALSNFVTRKARVALTVAAIALSVSLVVSVTSGYASVEAAVHKYLGEYMGSTDVEINKRTDQSMGTSDALLDELRRDPDVLKVDGRYELTVAIHVPGRGRAKRTAAIGIRRPDDRNSDFLRLLSGEWFDTPGGNGVVIDRGLADALKVEVGGEFVLPKTDPNDASAAPGFEMPLLSGDSTEAPTTEAPTTEAPTTEAPTTEASAAETQPAEPEVEGPRLKVVGIVHKPGILMTWMSTMYMPIETLQEFSGARGKVSRILVDTKPEADLDAFEARWKPRLAAIDPGLKLRTARQTRREMDKNLQGISALSYLGGTVSMLAATFIVFSALAMGVSERQRTLAMLRAVGALRGQVGRLVVMEGLALALVGVLVGVPLGWAWVAILAWMYGDVFSAGVVPSWGGILLGSAGSMLAALAASILPAWSATRVSPLEAMAPQASPDTARVPWRSALCGLVLIAVDPFLFFGPIERFAAAAGASDPAFAARELRFFAHFGLGLPCLMVGFFLLSPIFVWVTEKVFGRLVAAMFGLRYALLRQQLTTGIWRVAGTCSALMVGLSVLVVMQTNGHTMLRGWRLPDKFPDIFISANPLSGGGLTFEQQAKLAAVPGIRNGEVMPIGIASPQFVDNPFGGASGVTSIGLAAMMPDATMFIAVPPDRAFTMMELEFKEGNAADAGRLLAQGDHLVVTEEYRQVKGLGLGDTLKLKTTRGERAFTIAGVVWSPGIDVMVSMFDMGRQFDQRTAASVFGSLEDGRKYFGIEQVYLFAANLEYFVEREDILERVQKELGKEGMAAHDVRQIKAGIQRGFARILLLVSTVAFAAMAVASLGVTNTIMASIRSRRWQFGILRSIGVTRGQLMRLVLAEAFLIGLVGCALGLAAGFLMAVDANKLSEVIAGYQRTIWVPWPIIWMGVGIVIAISLLASIWPAVAVAKSEPLTLLQAGRAAS